MRRTTCLTSQRSRTLSLLRICSGAAEAAAGAVAAGADPVSADLVAVDPVAADPVAADRAGVRDRASVRDRAGVRALAALALVAHDGYGVVVAGGKPYAITNGYARGFAYR